jgi:hypothetical protein
MATNGKTCTIKMPYRPTDFQTTIVKPFYTEELPENNKQQRDDNSDSLESLAN